MSDTFPNPIQPGISSAWRLRPVLPWQALVMVSAIAVCAPQRTIAQPSPRRVLVLPYVDEADEAKSQEPLNQAVQNTSKLLNKTGAETVDPTIARLRLMAYGQFPRRIADQEKAEFRRLAKEALLAVGRINASAQGAIDASLAAAARGAITQAMNYARERIEALNIDDSTARLVIDTCLLGPRLLLAEGAAEQAAVLAAMECSKVVPGMEPLTASHPPEVLAVWAKANHASASTPRAFLRVSGCHECFLMVNGRLLDGPAHQMGVNPGTYRVQVRRPEQPPGKALVHEVTLAPSTMTTVYIASFEPYVRESPVGFFVASESGRALGRPMEALARQLDVERVLLVRARAAGLFELYVAAAVGGVGKCLRASTPDQLETVLAELMRCADGPPLLRVDAFDQPPVPHPVSPKSRQRPSHRLVGVGMLTAGVGALAASGIITGRQHISATTDRTLSVVAAAGGTLVSSSEPFWMPTAGERAPWWAWNGMVIGIIPVLYGAWLSSRDGECAATNDNGKCTERYMSKGRGSTFIFAGVPLLTLPASHYLAKKLWTESVSVSGSITHSAGTAHLTLQGTF